MKTLRFRLLLLIHLVCLMPGAVKAYTPPTTSFWEVAAAGYVGDEEWAQNNFGIFRKMEIEDQRGWILHHTHGWLWIESHEVENIWMYSPADGWLWTSMTAHPYFYSPDRGWLYYLQRTANPRWFHSRSEGTWFPRPLGYDVPDYFTRERSPELDELVQPELPAGFALVDEGAEDSMIASLEFLVTADGEVRQAALVSGHTVAFDRDDLRQAFIDAIRGSRFQPGLRDGQPVTLHHRHQFRFRSIE